MFNARPVAGAAMAACTMAFVAPAFGQSSAPAPTFKAGVELVRLDVRAMDDQGRPVADLKADDIRVVEDGRTLPVVLFQHIQERGEPFAELARRTIGSEVSTNQGAPRGHLYLFVFDEEHILPGNEQRARQAAERFVRRRVRPGDRVALYALPGPGPRIGFTADTRRILEALVRVRGSAEPDVPGSLASMRASEAYAIERGDERVLSAVTDRAVSQGGAIDVALTQRLAALANPEGEAMNVGEMLKEDARLLVQRADDTTRRMLAPLADIMRSMRDIDGRKTVVLFSEGFHGDHVSRELAAVAASAAQSYCVIDTIDINERQGELRDSDPSLAIRATEIQDRLASLGSLSAETDGTLVYFAAPRLDEVFDQVIDQRQDYYIVGFAPPEQALKTRGSYRRVSVRTSRPAIRLSARTGYALADDRRPLERRRAINLAMTAPFPVQGLPVEYTTYVLRGTSPGAHRVVVSLSADLPVASAAEKRAADVVFAVRSARDSRVVASGTDVIPLPTAAAPGATTGRGAYRVQFDAPPGEYLMRAVVREPGGLVGSADRRFVVRALDGPGVTSGDLIIGARAAGGLPVRARAFVDDGLAGLVEIYGRSRAQLDGVAVTTALVPAGGSTSLATVTAALAPARDSGGGAAREAVVSIPLAGIAPGAYIARTTVKADGETVAELERDLDVVAGAAPATATAASASQAAGAIEPLEILGGAYGRRFLSGLRGRLPNGSPAAKAADLAVGGNWRDAARTLSAVTPKDADTLTLAALVRFAARDAQAAADQFGEAIAAGAGGGASFFRGWAEASAGRMPQAISAWRQAAFVEPALVPAHLALVDAYVSLAQPALALQAAQAGLAAVPGSPELQERLATLGRR